jgi:hypothetical protein
MDPHLLEGADGNVESIAGLVQALGKSALFFRSSFVRAGKAKSFLAALSTTLAISSSLRFWIEKDPPFS